MKLNLRSRSKVGNAKTLNTTVLPGMTASKHQESECRWRVGSVFAPSEQHLKAPRRTMGAMGAMLP